MTALPKSFIVRLFLAITLVNLPLLGMLVPGLRILFFLPALFWINIPGFPLGLVIGSPHYEFQEFGVVPHGLLAWGLIEICWVVVALFLTWAWSKLIKV